MEPTPAPVQAPPAAITSLPSCPPAAAVDVDCVVYRVVKTPEVALKDLETHDEGGKMKQLADKCGRCGLSVLLTEEGVDLLYEKYPRIGKYVAVATLRPEHGKMLTDNDPVDSHTNVWFYRQVTVEIRKTLFAFHRELT